jgi:hypothetical protein
VQLREQDLTGKISHQACEIQALLDHIAALRRQVHIPGVLPVEPSAASAAASSSSSAAAASSSSWAAAALSASSASAPAAAEVPQTLLQLANHRDLPRTAGQSQGAAFESIRRRGLVLDVSRRSVRSQRQAQALQVLQEMQLDWIFKHLDIASRGNITLHETRALYMDIGLEDYPSETIFTEFGGQRQILGWGGFGLLVKSLQEAVGKTIDEMYASCPKQTRPCAREKGGRPLQALQLFRRSCAVSLSSDIKADSRDICISGAKELDVAKTGKAVIFHFPYRDWKAVQKIQGRLIRELEKKFSKKHVVFVASRNP